MPAGHASRSTAALAVGLWTAAAAAAAAAEPAGPLAVDEIRPAVEAVVGARAVADGAVALCDLHVHSRDRTATNLRAAPAADAPVVATLPAMRREYDMWIGPRLQVIAAKGGWLMVRDGRWVDGDGPEERVFAGPAWIAANLVGFTIEAPSLLAAPRADAVPVVALAPLPGAPDTWGSDSVAVDRVHGCSGSYAEVSVTLPDKRTARGWAGGLCANQLTTCGGGHVLHEAREGDLYLSAAACRAGGDRCPPGEP